MPPKTQSPDAVDARWMAFALAEGRKGLGLTRPNPAVGAVVVRNGRLISTGWHQAAGTPHAEIHALRGAGERARGATLYITLEPCSTHGRTPPCTGAILAAGIARVVVGAVDPNPAHAGAGLRLLRRAGVDCVSGVLQDEAEALIRGFARWITTGLPRVTLKMAVTLDGRIADASGRSKWITGPAARERVQQIRRESDAILVGAGTVIADDPSLLPRPDGGRRPLRVIVDGAGRCPATRRVFTDEHAAQTLVYTSGASSPRWRERIARGGARVVVAGRGVQLRPAAILRHLGREGMTSVLCEGGGTLAGAFLKARCVDELQWFIAPRLLGDRAVPVVSATGWTLPAHPGFTLCNVELLAPDVLLTLTAVPGKVPVTGTSR